MKSSHKLFSQHYSIGELVVTWQQNKLNQKVIKARREWKNKYCETKSQKYVNLMI